MSGYIVVAGAGTAPEIEAYLYSGRLAHHTDVRGRPRTVALIEGADYVPGQLERFSSGLFYSAWYESLGDAVEDYLHKAGFTNNPLDDI